MKLFYYLLTSLIAAEKSLAPFCIFHLLLFLYINNFPMMLVGMNFFVINWICTLNLLIYELIYFICSRKSSDIFSNLASALFSLSLVKIILDILTLSSKFSISLFKFLTLNLAVFHYRYCPLISFKLPKTPFSNITSKKKNQRLTLCSSKEHGKMYPCKISWEQNSFPYKVNQEKFDSLFLQANISSKNFIQTIYNISNCIQICALQCQTYFIHIFKFTCPICWGLYELECVILIKISTSRQQQYCLPETFGYDFCFLVKPSNFSKLNFKIS